MRLFLLLWTQNWIEEHVRRRQEYQGISAAEVAEAALDGMAKDDYEIAMGQSNDLFAGREEAERIFQRMNGNL